MIASITSSRSYCQFYLKQALVRLSVSECKGVCQGSVSACKGVCLSGLDHLQNCSKEKMKKVG